MLAMSKVHATARLPLYTPPAPVIQRRAAVVPVRLMPGPDVHCRHARHGCYLTPNLCGTFPSDAPGGRDNGPYVPDILLPRVEPEPPFGG